MIRHFLARWEGDPTDQSLRILLRAGVTNPDAAVRVRAIFAEQVLPVIRISSRIGRSCEPGCLPASSLAWRWRDIC